MADSMGFCCPGFQAGVRGRDLCPSPLTRPEAQKPPSSAGPPRASAASGHTPPAEIHENGRVVGERYDEAGTHLTVRALPAAMARLEKALG